MSAPSAERLASSLGGTRKMASVSAPSTVLPQKRPSKVPQVPQSTPAPSAHPPLNPAEHVIQVPERTLRTWNLAMFGFHTVLMILTLSVGNLDLNVPIFKTSLYIEYSNGNGTWTRDELRNPDGAGDVAWRVTPYYEESGRLYLTVLTASFFLLSAAFHLLNATVLRSYYVRELQHCRTPTRWTEYAISAPVMFVLIAYGVGVRGRDVLLGTAALISVTMAFGHWTEVRARPRSDDAWELPLLRRLLPWALGHLPQLVAWLLAILQFYDNSWDISRVPDFVHAIIWSELALFWAFGVAALVSQVGAPKHFYRGEIGFQILSLVSKGLLGILLIVNVLMLSRFDDIF